MNDIPKIAQQKVMLAFEVFPQMSAQARKFELSQIPENVWFFLLSSDAAEDL